MTGLDFVVVGAQKCGTTEFWRGLESHRGICTPMDKERGFFNSDSRYDQGLDAYARVVFGRAHEGQKLGTVTPGYMAQRDLGKVVARMRASTPDVRLIALLRDPIDRAVSQFRSALRRGRALGATFDEHVAGGIANGRDVPSAGEYGRILGHYLDALPREQLLILFTEDLDRDPATVYRRAFEHIGVDPGHVPPAYPDRLMRGGTASRTTPEALALIDEHMDEHVWPHVLDARERRRAFSFWLHYLWNIEPDDDGKAVSAELRGELEARFLADAAVLRDRFGVEPPWCATWRARQGSYTSR